MINNLGAFFTEKIMYILCCCLHVHRGSCQPYSRFLPDDSFLKFFDVNTESKVQGWLFLHLVWMTIF
jgi:phosphopantothenate---cysteine ligase (ATP)